MFVGRNKELVELTKELSSWKHKTEILVYGKRRVGKSTLIKEAARSFKGVVINHLCVSSTFEGNLELIYRSVTEAPGLPNMPGTTMNETLPAAGVAAIHIDLNTEFQGKLSDRSIQDAIQGLKKFRDHVEKKPVYMCVIVGHLDAVMKDPETGIYIVPLTSLRA